MMANQPEKVHLISIKDYDEDVIFNHLPEDLFSIISPGNTVILKPNWVLDQHQYREGEWQQVITHPSVITAVLRHVVERLENKGKIIITDGPELNADFNKILSYQPIDLWNKIAQERNISLEIIDLREDLYIQDKNVTIKKIKLPSDPLGKVEVNLVSKFSEFYRHKKSPKGYFGGGSDIKEVNRVHDGQNNLYSISKSVIQSDVFINIPKLKTHKKAGITCSLKNLVGVNTNRNYLPHNSIGTPSEHGDQFPDSKAKSRIESFFMPAIHQYVLKNPFAAKIFSPFMGMGKVVFGDNRQTIRGGSWYGNDTLWRMVLDINKVIFYGNIDGSLKPENISQMKKYISIVDGIVAGEGNGPKAPDAVKAGYLIAGFNPVSVDAVSSRIMNFDLEKIPSIARAFDIKHYPIADFTPDEIMVNFNGSCYSLQNLPKSLIINFKPHKGWVNHIELT